MKNFLFFLCCIFLSVGISSCSSGGANGYSEVECFDCFTPRNVHNRAYTVSNGVTTENEEMLFAGPTNCRLSGKEYVNVNKEIKEGDHIYIYVDKSGDEPRYYFFLRDTEEGGVYPLKEARKYIEELLGK